jgi:hypothetical protein
MKSSDVVVTLDKNKFTITFETPIQKTHLMNFEKKLLTVLQINNLVLTQDFSVKVQNIPNGVPLMKLFSVNLSRNSTQKPVK